MSKLDIALVQSQVHWHDIRKNLSMFEEKIAGIIEPIDLIVLPEMFSTGFSMDASEQADTMEGMGVPWMQEAAQRKNCVITGSLIIKEDEKHYNRLVWMRPDGTFDVYDKRHLFRYANEHLSYTAGKERKVVTLKDWGICLNVCYDLRFPVWARNRDDYDLLLYVANWPEERRYHWMTLLRARAIENLCFVVGVNRVGYDGMGHYFSGDSAVIHPNGKALIEVNRKEDIIYTSLNRSEIVQWKDQYGFQKDADDFEIRA